MKKQPLLRINGTPFDSLRKETFKSYKESMKWVIDEELEKAGVKVPRHTVDVIAHNCAYMAVTDH